MNYFVLTPDLPAFAGCFRKTPKRAFGEKKFPQTAGFFLAFWRANDDKQQAIKLHLYNFESLLGLREGGVLFPPNPLFPPGSAAYLPASSRL